jgi:hypothetical protein
MLTRKTLDRGKARRHFCDLARDAPSTLSPAAAAAAPPVLAIVPTHNCINKLAIGP